MSRHDRIEFAAAYLGLLAGLALLLSAALDPARGLPRVFGVGQLAGLPLMALACLWFVALLVVRSRTARTPRARENASTYLLLPAALWLGVAIHQVRSLPSLRAIHPAAALVYLAAAVVAVSSALREIAPLGELPRRLWNDARSARPRTWAGLAAVAAAVAASTLIPRPRVERSSGPSLADFDRWYAIQERHPLPGNGFGAAVTIVKFHDYQCPPCRKLFEELEPLAGGSPKPAVTYVDRDFPLEPECNPNVKTALHPLACEAAVAVRLAARRHRDQAMAAWLYRNQKELSKEAIVKAARDVGGVDDFEGAYAAALEDVKADVALGRRLGVQGTPTLFVNGVKLASASRPFVEAAIAYELRRRGGS
jgi:hypothetical protein